MGILLIDGEYLRKSIPLEKLNELILSAFGVINYPEKIIYYSAPIDDQQSKILSEIKNMEINDKGYITQYDNGKRVQKAVDGYIIVDIIEFSSDRRVQDINVIAGDGDLIAAFEKSYDCYNKKVNLIANKNSVSEKLLDYSKYFYIGEIISINNSPSLEKDNENIEFDNENIKFNQNIINIKTLWDKHKDKEGWISGTVIGQKRRLYDVKYSKGDLKNILKSLEESKIVELKPENNKKTLGYAVKFII